MDFLTQTLVFLTENSLYVFAAVAVALTVFFLLNVIRNVYFCDVARIKRSQKTLEKCVKSGNFFAFENSVPPFLRHQWNLYKNRADKTDKNAFCLDRRKKGARFLFLPTICCVVMGAYLWLFVQNTHKTSYLFACNVFFYLMTLGALLIKLSETAQHAKAKRVFNRYVSLVVAYFSTHVGELQLKNVDKAENDDVVNQIRLLQCSNDGEVAANVAKILQKDGVNVRRSVSEQRQINRALSQLLQRL